MTHPQPSQRPRDVLARPSLLLAIVLLGLNDHLFKQLFPGHLTGKLSDLAGLFAAPLVAWAALDLLRHKALSLRSLGWLCGSTALAFTLLKTCASVRETYLAAYGLLGLPARVVPDATDLLCLPALGLAWCYGAVHLGRRLPTGLGATCRRALRVVVVACFAVLTVATSPLPEPPSTTIAQVSSRTGGVPIELDARRYVDRPFELTLPAGDYRALTVLRRYHGVGHMLLDRDGCTSTEGETDVEVLVDFAAGDPALKGDPLRVAFWPKWGPAEDAAEGASPEGPETRREAAAGTPPCGRVLVRVTDAAGQDSLLEFRFVDGVGQ